MTLYPVPLVSISGLTEAEQEIVSGLSDRIYAYAAPNAEAQAYYEARRALSSPGFTIPPPVASRLAPVVGAAETVVDVLEERLDFLGWDDQGPGSLGLDRVYDRNHLDSEGPMAHTDALIYGTSFVRVGVDDDGEPLVTAHSPLSTTGVKDPSSRMLSAAWTELDPDGEARRAQLDVPSATVVLREVQGRWTVEDRDDHRLGRVLVVQISNRPRASRRGGRSEITPAIRSLIEDMMRAGLGMNVNTLFYSIPQLMVLGRGRDAFVDRDGNPVSGWRILAGHALAIDKDADGDTPTVQQLTMASPAPFIEQLREFRMQVASVAGMPADYLGIQTSNPSSADAIRAGEARLVKRAERRISTFGRAWQEVGRLAVMVRDGSAPQDFDQRISPEWASPETRTPAATADEIVKLVGAGVLSPTSAIVRRRLGLTRSEQRTLASEQRQASGGAVLEMLRQAAQSEPLAAPDVVGG